jgi:hypothetical protein
MQSYTSLNPDPCNLPHESTVYYRKHGVHYSNRTSTLQSLDHAPHTGILLTQQQMHKIEGGEGGARATL